MNRHGYSFDADSVKSPLLQCLLVNLYGGAEASTDREFCISPKSQRSKLSMEITSQLVKPPGECAIRGNFDKK